MPSRCSGRPGGLTACEKALGLASIFILRLLQSMGRIGIKGTSQSIDRLIPLVGGQIAALARGGPLLGCLLGNQTRDVVAVFFIETPRSSELGSATNEKTQAEGLG